MTREIKIKKCQLETLQHFIELTENNIKEWNEQYEKKLEKKERIKREIIYSPAEEQIEKLNLERKTIQDEMYDIQIWIDAGKKMLQELKSLI